MSTSTILNPATGQEISEVPQLSVEETQAAIERAQAAFASWREVSAADRARLLRRFALLVEENLEALALLEVKNTGHTLGNARWEAGNVRDVLNYYAGAPERPNGQQIPVSGGISVTFHEPVGVVGVIVPWNFPMPIAGWAFAPALAAGNTVVLKPAELTPLTALRLAELAQEAGIPEGVFQVLPGKGSVVGQTIVEHPAVAKLVFTGSTEVGSQIQASAAQQLKRVTLELGGKSANIIFADADLEAAVAGAPGGAFDNAGQDCCSRSRILVQDSIYEEFMSLLEPAVSNFTVGDPLAEGTAMGPLISAAHRESVASYVDADAVAFAGQAPEGAGFWFPPTVLAAPSSRTSPGFQKACREEIFGPVLTVQRFSSETEALSMANDTRYGLSGSIWTRDLGRALRMARGVEAGNLSVNSHSSVRYNTPFGGYKMSGLGRELGPDALDAFTEVKTVFFAQD